VPHESLLVPAKLQLPQPGHRHGLGRLIGASTSLAAAELARKIDVPLLVLAEDPRQADQLESEIRFFVGDDIEVQHFVEWETLPWDSFSPHQDIISDRLSVLAALRKKQAGIVVASAPSLLQRLPPVDYVAARSLSMRSGQTLPREPFIDSLAAAGYLRVPQVSEHGEFAVRGSLIDVFPMGSTRPIRIDFFDDDIESLRYFSPENQLSADVIDAVDILPAREIPLDADAVRDFRERYRERFEGQPGRSRVYREVSDGIAHGGIEYYLPLFFDSTATLLDYLPGDCAVFAPHALESILEQAWAEIEERYQL
jgi:transcription-repair coupling factor (superfamily II helicase)